MKGLVYFLIGLFVVIVTLIGFVYYDSSPIYFLGEQAKELCLLLALSIMSKRLQWQALYIILLTLSALSFCELLDEINGRNTTIYSNDYILITIAGITAIYLLTKQWQKLKKKY